MTRVIGFTFLVFFFLADCISAAETFRFDRSWPLLPQPYYMSPTDVAIDTKGNVYVPDVLNAKIQKYSPDGLLINRWGHGVESGDVVTDNALGQILCFP